jgi:hypothetical protein
LGNHAPPRCGVSSEENALGCLAPWPVSCSAFLGWRRAYRAQQLVLRSALEAGWCLARFAMRALTDPERTCWKLALYAGLLAGRGWAGGQRAQVAGYDDENGPE